MKLFHQKSDPWLIWSMVILLSSSFLMVYSTTAQMSLEHYASSVHMIKVHVVHVIVGLIAFFIALNFPVALLKRFSSVAMILAMVLLALVLVPGLGQTAGGAQRWIAMGPLRFQPGELVKLLTIIYFSGYIARHRHKMSHLMPGTIVPFIVIGALGFLLLLEPDFGSTAIVTGVVLSQLFTASRITHLLGAGVMGGLAGASLIYSSPYRLRRLEAFLNPLENASGSGYQLVQSLVAISSGGMTGEGLGAGRQKLFYLPAAHTDFIFSMIAEELGFVGCMVILMVFLVIAYRGLGIASRLRSDVFCSSLATGLTMLLVLPALLNIGVVSGVLPTKGLVLPLVAYGGTAMVVNLTVLGLLVRLSRQSGAIESDG